MYYRITIQPTGKAVDRRGQELVQQAESLGVSRLEDVCAQTLYFLRGDITAGQLDLLCEQLFSEPLVERAEWESVQGSPKVPSHGGKTWTVEVGLHPGVTDPVAGQIVTSASIVGVSGIQAATGRRFLLTGDLDEEAVHTIARRLLCNETIQHYYLGAMIPNFTDVTSQGQLVEMVELSHLSDGELQELSRRRLLALSLEEMRAIRDYFAARGREPTDVEMETLAQTWSEHCVHKTFRAQITFPSSPGGQGPVCQIDGLLRSYIRAATEKVNKPWIRSAFVDNAGIIDFDERFEVSFKVETHNHPSALEPFGGANTGVGGVVRDIIGVSARPIACTDVFCFGPVDLPQAQVPEGSLHPSRIRAGVIAGVEDYGNKLGLPTLSGAVLYDASYTANPLVYVGCVGIAPKGSHPTQPQAGDLAVVLGGRTGRDGLHGATFSSESLTHETGEIAGTAVQIGDPIVEKDVMEVVCQARDARLYSAITDCGAGGLSSALGELGKSLGVDVDLARVPLKYPGLQPWEIWLSEAQERMVMAVLPQNWPALKAICDEWGVEATTVGHFTDTGRLVVRYNGQVTADLEMGFLHDGLPRLKLEAVWPDSPSNQATIPPQPYGSGEDLSRSLLALLSHPNIASKEDIIRRYDHEVGAGTIVKPLTGVADAGPSDAVVLKPLGTWDHRKALVLSLGINPEIGKVDPYAMAVSVIDEAIRNAVAVGADPDQIALLDNFCWGNPRRPDQLGALVRAAQGCHDVALAYGAPFISGKDSLNNEYIGPNGDRIPIPGTLLISALGIIPDLGKAVTMDLKEAGSILFLIGETREELAGSHYSLVLHDGRVSGNPPALPRNGLALYRALFTAIQAGLVRSCHDLSEGGLGVAAAEMCLAGRLGMELRLPAMLVDDPAMPPLVRMFSESNGRLLVEVRPDDEAAFLNAMIGQPVAAIGITGGKHLIIRGEKGEELLRLNIETLEEAWRGTQREVSP